VCLFLIAITVLDKNLDYLILSEIKDRIKKEGGYLVFRKIHGGGEILYVINFGIGQEKIKGVMLINPPQEEQIKWENLEKIKIKALLIVKEDAEIFLGRLMEKGFYIDQVLYPD
jgi:hypothetical protein